MGSRPIEAAALACAVVLAFAVGAPVAAAATIVVNDSSDTLDDAGCAASGTGTCTLRDAMTFASANPTDLPHEIHFALAGAGVHTIKLDADLPSALWSLTIDGYTQPGSSANTNGPGLPDNAVLLIEIDGNGNECFTLGGNPNTVRGLIINRCGGYGIRLLPEVGQSVVEGNFIGTDPTGKLSRPNAGGVSVREGLGGVGGLYIVGGETPAARNVISGNSGAGVAVGGSRTIIQGNFIGTDSAGTAALANGGSGIEVSRISAVDIRDNVVSGNAGRGVSLTEADANIYGNLIGTDVSGTVPLGNRLTGVWITAPESLLAHNEIRGNTIAFNGSGDPVGGGVVNSLGLHPLGFSDPSILGNSIFDNASDGSLADRGLGIDLQGYGPTPNDACNGTEENRRAQNFPVLTGAFASDSAIRVRGTLDSTARTRFRIEFFASPACDPSGYGEGETFLGGTEVTEDDSCNAAFDLSLPVSVAPGQYVTATATEASTSEFSPCILVVPAPSPVAAPVTIAVDPAAGAGSDGNGVFEPGETVTIKPSWKNVGTQGVTLDAAASNFSGEGYGAYSIVAGAAHYGTIPAGATADCGTHCYSLSVANLSPHPSTHWDATVIETPATDDPPRVWTLHLGDSFQDVPRANPYYKKIEALLHGGVTAGCSGTGYCPDKDVSRYELAAFIARGIAGGGANIPSSGTVNGKPYDCTIGGTSIFSDVAPADDICKHVHYLALQNVTLGCSGTEFCPAAIANRDSMAGFIAKAVVAPGGGPAVPLVYGPDTVTGRSYSCDLGGPNTHFTDVPPTDPFCKHVHFLWAKGIIDGCGADQYCPTESVTRETMAKFLVNAFQIKLYGP